MDEQTKAPLVLIVEDDPLLSDLVSKKFVTENIPTVYAATGEAALELLRTEPLPDVVLLDIRLPGIDGFDVLQQIRSNPETKDLPVIVFSNFGEESDVARAKELGATKFVVKISLSLNEVANLVRAVAKK